MACQVTLPLWGRRDYQHAPKETHDAIPSPRRFSVTRKWPAQRPSASSFYSLPTPNGVKVSIALEEMQLPYEAHLVSFQTNDQLTPEFVGTFPNNKIPAIIDPQGPGGKPLALFESAAILIYLAEKAGAARCPQTPQRATRRCEVG